MVIIETKPQKKRRSYKTNESKTQAQCVRWFHNTYPEFRGLFFHVSNENHRWDSNVRQGAIRKALGVVAGVSDLICLIPRGTSGALLIEMKDENGKQSPSQKEWQKLVEAQGYKYFVCRSLEQFQEIVENYLKEK